MPPKFPKQVGPQLVNKIMPWFESFWHERKRYPLNDEIAQKFKFTPMQIEQLHASKFWQKALANRGIRFESSDDLTAEQIAAISLITNFSDSRSPEVKLQAIGVSPEQLSGWYSDPVFLRELERRTDSVMQTSHAEVQASLIRQAKRGNVGAIKFYYEVTGRAQTPETLNLKRALQITLEAIEKHVQDPEILQAISQEIYARQSLEAANNSPVAEPAQRAIEGV